MKLSEIRKCKNQKELLRRIQEIRCKIFGLNYELKEIEKRVIELEHERIGQTSLTDQIK
jgi:hypothetical protein